MMQIYLPFDSVAKNVTVLSEHDLGVQRNCAVAILEAIAGKSRSWRWHPAATMWVGNEHLLAHIAIKLNNEWVQQLAASQGETPTGQKQFMQKYNQQLIDLGFDIKIAAIQPLPMPWWWGDKTFHSRMRSYMLRHDFDWYGQFFPKTKIDLPNMWPRPDYKGDFIIVRHVEVDHSPVQYVLNNKPIYQPAMNMSPKDFAAHVNDLHNLMPDSRTPIDSKEAIMDSLRALHDRFHQKRVYGSHDHV